MTEAQPRCHNCWTALLPNGWAPRGRGLPACCENPDDVDPSERRTREECWRARAEEWNEENDYESDKTRCF